MNICVVDLEKEMRDIISHQLQKKKTKKLCKNLALPLNRDGVVKAMKL